MIVGHFINDLLITNGWPKSPRQKRAWMKKGPEGRARSGHRTHGDRPVGLEVTLIHELSICSLLYALCRVESCWRPQECKPCELSANSRQLCIVSRVPNVLGLTTELCALLLEREGVKTLLKVNLKYEPSTLEAEEALLPSSAQLDTHPCQLGPPR